MEKPFHLSSSLQEFNKIIKAFNQLYRDAAQKLGLSNSAFDIFYTICELGGHCQQKDICEATFIPKQTVHSAILLLEKEGLIQLAPRKGRAVDISLTEAGEEKVHSLMTPVFHLENASFDAMTLEETETMLTLNQRYLEILKKEFSKL